MQTLSSSFGSFEIAEITPLLDPLFSVIPNPPARIWVEGSSKAMQLLGRVPEDGVAIVGTRSPDRRSIHLVQESVRRISGSDKIIISGLARGIDSIAHEAALRNGLPTIALIGCGIRKTYPPENTSLRKRILEEDGLVISEFPPESSPRPSFFVQRNRLIAGLAKATWIVQSGYRSGALNTAHWALKQNRDLYVTPSFPGDPSFLGNELLLKRHPSARPFWSAEDLASTWLELFSQVETRRKEGIQSPEIDLHLEIEMGMRDGKSLFSLLKIRSERTKENLSELIRQMEERR